MHERPFDKHLLPECRSPEVATAFWPVCLGYAAVVLAFEVIARKAGL